MTNRDERATARRSALTVVTVLVAIGVWQLYRARPVATAVFIGLAALLAMVTVLSSRATLAFHRAWMGIADVLGYINSRVLLSVVYYGLVTPLGALLRITGHDSLTRRGKRQPSYWTRRSPVRQSREGFERGF